MQLHDIKPPEQIWVMGYEDDQGDWQEYRMIGTQEEANQLDRFMTAVEDAGVGINEVTIYKLDRGSLDRINIVLANMQDQYLEYLEEPEHD